MEDPIGDPGPTGIEGDHPPAQAFQTALQIRDVLFSVKQDTKRGRNDINKSVKTQSTFHRPVELSAVHVVWRVGRESLENGIFDTFL